MDIFQIIKKQEDNLLHGKAIKIGKYADHNHTEKISTISAYLNNQHISGKTDSKGREKPFLTLGLQFAYNWYKLTDISRKHIKFRASNSKQRLKALVATLLFRDWMNKHNFGQWLNKWGWTLSCYGSAVSKLVEKNGELIPTIVEWDKMICDPIDFTNNPKIEKLYFTPAQLRQQPYDKEKIEEAIKNYKEIRETLEGQDIDVSSEYIGIYEVHGNLPLSLLTDRKEDENEYRQQMHIVFMHQNRDKEDVNVSLYRGKEEKDPYMISHLLEQDGRTLSIGAIESSFDAQWMVNDMAKKTLDQLEIASKLAVQTSDTRFTGKNYLEDFDNGFIAIHEQGQPLIPVNNQSHDIPVMLQFLELFKQNGREATGSYESITGQTMPSGTPYSLGAMLNQEARGLFDMFRENKGLALEQIIRTYVIPHFKKTLKTTDELVAVLSGEELEEFDELTLPARLGQQLKTLLQVGIPSTDQLMAMTEMEGTRRIIRPSDNENKTWKEYFGDFEFDIEVDITGENRDKQATLLSLDTLLQRMSADQQAFSPEDRRKVMNKIIDEIGTDVFSPLQLKGIPQQGAVEPMQRAVEPMQMGQQVGMSELTNQLK